MSKSTSSAPDCADPAVAAAFNSTALTIPVPSARPMPTLPHTPVDLAVKRRQLFEMTEPVGHEHV